jgi:hypothetical protein
MSDLSAVAPRETVSDVHLPMINTIAANRATQPMAGTISHNVSSFMVQAYGAQFTPIVIRWDIVRSGEWKSGEPYTRQVRLLYVGGESR